MPRLVLLDWMVLGAPAPFLDALKGMAAPETTRAVVDQVTAMWVGLMATFADEMWARAAREISAEFATNGVPLEAVAALDPPPPTLHLYAQQGFASEHSWFEVEHLDAQSHFPMFEVPDAIADRLRSQVD